MPLNKEDIVAPLIAAYLEQLIDYNFSQLVFPDGRKSQLLFFADEFHLVRLRKIPQWVAVLRSFGFAAILTFQSVAQLRQKYGQSGMEAIFECCRTKVIFASGSGKSAQEAEQMLGDKDVVYTQNSRGRVGLTQTKIRQKVPLWSAIDFMRMRRGECVIINKGYAASSRAGIPFLTVIEIPQTEKQLAKKYENKWKLRREELSAQNNKYSREDLVAQLEKSVEVAKEKLPEVNNEKSEETEAQSSTTEPWKNSQTKGILKPFMPEFSI